jgi:hypothetical protein
MIIVKIIMAARKWKTVMPGEETEGRQEVATTRGRIEIRMIREKMKTKIDLFEAYS